MRPVSHFEDNWINVDRSADPGFFVAFLDATRRQAIEVARRSPAHAFAHLDLRRGLAILDAGCGTGDLTALLAEQVAPDGRAVGIDLSETMVSEARHRATETLVPVSFEVADVQQLPFPDASFDRTLASQLLVHVPDPGRAIDEMCRVTRPGGKLVLGEMDWDTLVMGLSDRALARRVTHFFCDGIRNGLIIREVPGELRARGLGEITILPQVLVFEDPPFFSRWVLEPALASAASGLSEEDARRVRNDWDERARSGRAYAISTFLTVVATH